MSYDGNQWDNPPATIEVVNRDDLYLSNVLLLCVECQQPIRARINTPQWIRVEWISPSGECQACHAKAKEDDRNGQS